MSVGEHHERPLRCSPSRSVVVATLVAGFGVEAAQPLNEASGGDGAHLLDLERRGSVEAVVAVGFDDHVQRELAQGRRSGHDDREAQVRVMEAIV